MDYPKELAQAGGRHTAARSDLERVEAERDRLIRRAHRQGKLSTRTIAAHVGVSHQRVAQIVKGNASAGDV